jgi:DNA invertase Pin-like site-specific DNA recombinase
MKKKKTKPGPKLLSPYTKEMEKLIKDTYIDLPENKRRTYADFEALKLQRGGKRYIANLLGCSRNTIRKGIAELKNKGSDPLCQCR